MKNLSVYILLVMCTLLMTYTVQADKTSDLSAYPQRDFLVGVWEDPSVSKEVLRVRAATQLTEKVFDKVKVLLAGNSMNKEAYDQVREHYGLVLQGAKDAKLTGLNTKSGASYVIVYIKRSYLQSAYAQQETELRNRINGIIARAQAADNSGELDSAAKIFMSSYPLYEELKEAELIQLGTNYKPSSSAFANLHAAAVGTAKGTLMMSHKEVIKRVNEIRNPLIYNLDTIADFVADRRAPTPSVAAELVSPDLAAVQSGVKRLGSQLQQLMQANLGQNQQRVAQLRRRLPAPVRLLRDMAQRLDEQTLRMKRSLDNNLTLRRARVDRFADLLSRANPTQSLKAHRARCNTLFTRLRNCSGTILQQRQQRLASLARALQAISHQATLKRGYAIVTDADRNIVRRAGQLQKGDTICAQFIEGKAWSTVHRLEQEETGQKNKRDGKT